MFQNSWALNGVQLNRQIRRSQVIKNLVRSDPRMILDIGSAEGYTTSFLTREGRIVIGVEINLDSIKIANKKVSDAFFVCASINFLPFKDEIFEIVSVLEVLEHLPSEIQHNGLSEANRVLKSKGSLIISVPYREKRIYTKCIHCDMMTPLYGHLHSMDEKSIANILPNQMYKLMNKLIMPNFYFILCSNFFQKFPLSLWIKMNNLFGKLKIYRGYWIILKFYKS